MLNHDLWTIGVTIGAALGAFAGIVQLGALYEVLQEKRRHREWAKQYNMRPRL